MQKVHSGLHLVHVLSAGTTGSGGADLQILRIELNFHRIGFRHHRHRGGGRVHTALGFRGGHPLHPMNARFKFQLAVDAVSFHREDQFPEASQIGFG